MAAFAYVADAPSVPHAVDATPWDPATAADHALPLHSPPFFSGREHWMTASPATFAVACRSITGLTLTPSATASGPHLVGVAGVAEADNRLTFFRARTREDAERTFDAFRTCMQTEGGVMTARATPEGLVLY